MQKTLDADATGVYLITVTPFTDSGALDLASTDGMVDFCLQAGVTGLTVLGIMGEATKLTAEESRVFVKQVLARASGQVPVVVGASGAGFAPMREPTRSVKDLGACGVMVAPAPGLREIAQKGMARRIDFLGVQPDIVATGERPVER
jgi:4-hydroxy-tetrahydrodipicolinate synthase